METWGDALKLSLRALLKFSMLTPLCRELSTMVLSHTLFKLSMWAKISVNRSRGSSWSSSREASILSCFFPNYNHFLQPYFFMLHSSSG